MPRSVSTRQQVAHLVEPDDIEVLDVLGPTIQFLTSPDAGDAPCIMRGTMPPAFAVPLHSHPDPETFLLIAGTVEGLAVAGDDVNWVAIEPGQVFHVPPDAKHAWRNPGPLPAVMIVVSTGTMGRFFREIGRPRAKDAPPAEPSPEQVARFQEVAKKYGYWNASPEENAAVGLSITG